MFAVPRVHQTFSRKCRYCTTGTAYWPDSDLFDHCPRCLEPTERSLSKPMPAADAIRLKREYEFGWWLWETGGL